VKNKGNNMAKDADRRWPGVVICFGRQFQ